MRVFSTAIRTTLNMAISQASCTAYAMFLCRAPISLSGARTGPKSGAMPENEPLPFPKSRFQCTRYGSATGSMNASTFTPGSPYGAKPMTFHSSLFG